MRRLLLAFLPLLVALELGFGCNGSGQLAGTAGSGSIGAGASTPDGGTTGGQGNGGRAGSPPSDAGTSPVFLAVTPNPIAEEGGSATSSDALLAELTAYAAGMRAMVVALPWDGFDPLDTSALQARIDGYLARQLRVIVTLLVVDRHADHRPPALGGAAWDSPETKAALASTLDALVGAVGPKLSAIVLGRDVDAYLERHSGEQTALLSLLSGADDQLAAAAPQLPRGVGLRFAGADPPGAYQTLLGLGDLVVLSYLPGAGQDGLPGDLSLAKDLDAMIALAEGRPVLLQALGYTSSESLGGSEEAQRDVLSDFFAALEPRRSSFPYVNVTMLHDLSDAACDAYAAEQGLDPGDPLELYVCATGVRDAQGEPKPAWSVLLQAAAQLASP